MTLAAAVTAGCVSTDPPRAADVRTHSSSPASAAAGQSSGDRHATPTMQQVEHCRTIDPSRSSQSWFGPGRDDCRRYAQGLLDQGNWMYAFELFRPFAESGEAHAQYVLGRLILERRTPGSPPHGRVFPNPQSYALAARPWLAQAALQGHLEAAELLVQTYCCNNNLNLGESAVEVAEAVPHLMRAMELGSASAALMLGAYHSVGLGVARDDARARQLLRQSIERARDQPALSKVRQSAQELLVEMDKRDQEAERQRRLADERRQRAAREAAQAREAEQLRREQARLEATRRAAEADRARRQAEEEARLNREREERERPIREARQRAREEQLERERQAQCDRLARVCRGQPNLADSVKEDLSARLRVHPREISLRRVELSRNTYFGCNCEVVLYTPVGAKTCEVRQFDDGSVAQVRCP